MANALLVAWRSASPERRWQPVGRLEYEGGVYRFVYTQSAKMLADFQPFAQMENLEEVYESSELFPVFANRLLSKNRPEYEAYLQWSGFDPDHAPDPISILGVTEGRRQTDSIEVFPCPVLDRNRCYVNKFFVHGLSRMSPVVHARINQLESNEELCLLVENHNFFDTKALSLTDQNSLMIGFIPRYLAQNVRRIVSDHTTDYIHVFVARVNKDAPLRQRLLCRLHASWPVGFGPCNGEAFRPIPAQVAASFDEAISAPP
jgi:hypothetical protein